MKRLLTILLLLLSFGLKAQITMVCTVNALSGGSGVTTTTVNATTGQLVTVELSYHLTVPANVSDNLGNTYTQLTAQSNGNMGTVIYYYLGTNVSSSMTWTTTSRFAGLNIAVFKAVGTLSYDQQSGSSSFGTPLTPGSITPSKSSNVFVTVFGTFNGSQPSIPTGYSTISTYPTATAEGGGAGYLIQSSASASNPSWSGTGTNQAVSLACFIETVPSTNNSNFFFMQGGIYKMEAPGHYINQDIRGLGKYAPLSDQEFNSQYIKLYAVKEEELTLT